MLTRIRAALHRWRHGTTIDAEHLAILLAPYTVNQDDLMWDL